MLPKSFMRKCRIFSVDQRGAVLVLVSLSLVALMGFAAFCLDVGALYKARREMVTAADAAALAGAKELAISGGANDAIDEAEAYASSNGATEINAKVKCTSDGRQVIEVTAGKNVEYTFAKVLGFDNKVVSAKAIATWGYPTEVKGGNVLPLFMEPEQYYAGDSNLHIKSNEYSGNWGLLDVGSGKRTVKDALEGYPLDLSEVFSVGEPTMAESEPGFGGNAIVEAVEVRMDRYSNDEVTMDGLIPIVQVIEGGGVVELKVLGFAVYRIEDVITKKGDEKKGKYPLGSSNAPKDLIGEDPPKAYPYGFEVGTIIGKLVSGEMVDVNVVLNEGDQDPSYNYGATYVKLID